MNFNEKILREALLVFLAIVLSIFLIRLTNLDIIVSDYAFTLTNFKENSLVVILSKVGKYLCLIFLLICGVLLLSSQTYRNNFKNGFLIAVFILILGPGVINNLLLKPYFNRPRPIEITNYNEKSHIQFVPPLSLGTGSDGSSFPSGHAGAAFFFIFPWFIQEFREKYRFKILLPGLILGLFISTLRVLGGHHFLSDVIASFGVVYLSGGVVSFLLCFSEKKKIISQ